MQVNNLSVVSIVHEIHRESMNELAEILQMGPDNLSTKLVDSSGQVFYGCHSWWTQEKYNIFKNYAVLESMGVDIKRYIPAIHAMFDAIIDTANMLQDQKDVIAGINWKNTLELLGLSEVARPEAEVIPQESD